MKTRTGGYGIGFRRGWSDWQKDLPRLARWAKEAGFEAIDLGRVMADDVGVLEAAGLKTGSVDLLDWSGLVTSDIGQRDEAIRKNIEYVRSSAAAGVKAFFTVIMPADAAKKRAENHRLAVEAYAPIAEACAAAGAALAIEGWPGGAPHLANLCCTPETVRAFLKDVGPGAGLNYDPSHLIRLQVDHVRFLREFAQHVKHVHAKDTDIDAEAMYEYGTQPAAFAKPHGFGEWTWRYSLPGHGQARWGEIIGILKESGYGGLVSIELEDEHFNGTEEGEKQGLLRSLQYLCGV
jgi:sugar phosphate isomerase/epimerase